MTTQQTLNLQKHNKDALINNTDQLVIKKETDFHEEEKDTLANDDNQLDRITNEASNETFVRKNLTNKKKRSSTSGKNITLSPTFPVPSYTR